MLDGILGPAALSGYAHARRDLVLFDPKAVTDVLDIGCYRGATGAYLKTLNPAVHVVGMEADSRAVEAARKTYDEVHCVDLESAGAFTRLGRARFDVIIFGDVLEHLIEPEAALKSSVGYLKDNGIVVISLPNVQFWEALVTISFGRFPRRPSGLFDATHVRFFTKYEAIQLVSKADLLLVKLKRNFRIIEFKRFGFLNHLCPILYPLMWIMAPYFTYQYVMVCRRNVSSVEASTER